MISFYLHRIDCEPETETASPFDARTLMRLRNN